MEVWVLVSSFLFVAVLYAAGFVFLGLDARRTFRHGRELDVLMTRHTQEIIERGERETREIIERGAQETRAMLARTDELIRATHADTQVLIRMILERMDRPRPPEPA